MPDQTPNPTGGTTQPSSSLANSIQAAQESAWLKLRDQAKTATDVSNMMVDLSPNDFNALNDQIREAKRYGRKEVVYKGFKLPVPDKPAPVLKKLFEEKQALGQRQMETASAGLGQQVFGTGVGGVTGELGKMFGIKPKKKKEEGKKKKEEPSSAKATAGKEGKKKEETAKTEENKSESAETTTEEREAGATLRPEQPETAAGPTGTVRIPPPIIPTTGPTGTVRIQQPEAKTGPTGTIRIQQPGTTGRGPKGTLRIPQAGAGPTGTLRIQQPTATKGGTVRIPAATKGGTVRIPTSTKGGTVRIAQPGAGPTGTIRIQQPGTAVRGPKGTLRIAQPGAGPTGTLKIQQQSTSPTSSAATLKGVGPTQPQPARTIRGMVEPAEQAVSDSESADGDRGATEEAKKIDDLQHQEKILEGQIDRLNGEMEASKSRIAKNHDATAEYKSLQADLRHIQQARGELPQDLSAEERAKIDAKDHEDITAINRRLTELKSTVGENPDETQDLERSFLDGRKKELEGLKKEVDGIRDEIIAANELVINGRAIPVQRNASPLGAKENEPVGRTAAASAVGAAAMAAGVAGAALGASLESTRKVTAKTTGAAVQAATEPTAAPSSVQVTKERKATVTSTQTGQQAAPQEAAPSVESVNVEKERKASIETTVPSAAVAPPPPTTTPNDVRVERERKVSVSGAAPAVSASPTARQQSRAAFHMPGGAPPSGIPPTGAPPTGGGGPPGPRATPTLSTQELLNQADVFVQETKKLTARMMANPSNVMLKAEMRGLRDRASGLMGQIGNTQKSVSMFSPEHTELQNLNDRVGFIQSSLAGDAGIGASLELSAGLGLYDRERDKIGNVLAPGGGTAPPPARRMGPSPTGIAGPSAIAGEEPVPGSTFPGPRSPRPMVGTAAQRGAATQMSAAMQLGAAQQQAAMQQMAGEGVAEQAGGLATDQSNLTESSIPPDVRSQIMGEQGGRTRSSVLPGQYAPPGYEDVYGGGRSPQHQIRQERTPGSAVSLEEPTEEEEAEGGGELGSDEAERASVLAQQQDQARRSSAFTGGPALPGGKAARPGAAPGGAPAKPPAPRPMPATGGGKTAAAGALSPTQMGMLLAAQKAKSVLARNEFLRQQMEGMQRTAKNLQNIWRIVNASELASSEAAFPILMWVLTSNLQLINKYSFKVRFIPPASLVEDAFTMCTDCILGSSCLMNFIFYIAIVSLLALPYIVIGGTVVNVVGMDAIRKSLELLAQMTGLK